MQAILGHLDSVLLSIWTGAWVGRAGILAQLCSFPFLTPEIMGRERLKRAEEALRKGLESAAVRRVAISVWVGVFVVVYFAALSPVPMLFPHPSFLDFIAVVGFLTFSAFFSFVFRGVVKHRLRGRQDDAANALFAEQGLSARAVSVVLRPLEFKRVVQPSLVEWIYWAWSIPFDVIWFIVYVIVPKGILSVVHLQQRVLAAQHRLRRFVFGIGITLFFGGMLAQFAATF
jgi:hypothetical protein